MGEAENKKIIKAEKELIEIPFGPKDKIIIRSQHFLNNEIRERIKKDIGLFINNPEQRVLILEDDLKFYILRNTVTDGEEKNTVKSFKE